VRVLVSVFDEAGNVLAPELLRVDAVLFEESRRRVTGDESLVVGEDDSEDPRIAVRQRRSPWL